MIFLTARYLLKDLHKQLHFYKPYLFLDVFLILSISCFIIKDEYSYTTLINCLLVFYLLVISITDFKYQIIPDRITYLYIIVGLLICVLSEDHSPYDAIIGLVTGFSIFFLISVIATKIFKKPALGGGDIKLAAMLGIYVGWEGIIMSLFLASILALIFVLICYLIKREYIPKVSFGPFIVLSAISLISYKTELIFLFSN